jgi:Fur family ferric uptake transcriptional regulator
MVLAALHELDGHASVDDIHQRVRARSSAVDKTTVYRTLELMHELGIVHEVELGDGVLRDELSLHRPHAHLLCTRCGKLLTIPCDQLDALDALLAREFGFQLDRSHQVVRGLCGACQVEADDLAGCEIEEALDAPRAVVEPGSGSHAAR